MDDFEFTDSLNFEIKFTFSQLITILITLLMITCFFTLQNYSMNYRPSDVADGIVQMMTITIQYLLLIVLLFWLGRANKNRIGS
ncbi:MAG: hypothetical protein ACXAAH_06905 [Promethearchaeota archaeon]|jgi:hypothetical protein